MIEILRETFQMDSTVINDFGSGWAFYIRKMGDVYGKFPCSKFSCPGCSDWLDCDRQNRNGHEKF